jgi:integrase
MPVKLLMTWVPATKRWAKNHRGKSYSVSCRQLGCPPTKESSWQAANSWWAARQAELDRQPPPDLTTSNVVRLLSDHGPLVLVEEVENGLTAQNILRLLEAFAGQPLTDQAGVEAAVRSLVARHQSAPLPAGYASRAIGPEGAGQLDARLPVILDGAGSGDRTLGGQAAAWLEVLQASVAGGQMHPTRYDSYRGNVNVFTDWVGGAQPVEVVNSAKLEQFQAFLLRRVAERKAWVRDPTPPSSGQKKPGYAPAYAHSILGTVKRFVTRLADHGLIRPPGNLRGLRIEKGRKKVETFTAEELRRLLEGCAAGAPKTGLYLLLMMNAGMYASDISDLGRDEVDFARGVVTRPRSKTPDGPIVAYKLWPETMGLLRRFAATGAVVPNDRGSPRLLLSERGKPLVTAALVGGGRLKRTDAVKGAYRRLLARLKVKAAKPLKLVRKTSATLLGEHPHYKFYAQYFLAHSPRSVADAHYVVPSDVEFFAALDWLRGRYGLG